MNYVILIGKYKYIIEEKKKDGRRPEIPSLEVPKSIG